MDASPGDLQVPEGLETAVEPDSHSISIVGDGIHIIHTLYTLRIWYIYFYVRSARRTRELPISISFPRLRANFPSVRRYETLSLIRLARIITSILYTLIYLILYRGFLPIYILQYHYYNYYHCAEFI